MSKYECASCANRNTRLCERCMAVLNEGEILNPPSMFCRTVNLPPEEGEVHTTDQEYLESVIHRYLRAGKPIPLSVVIMLNKITQVTEE